MSHPDIRKGGSVKCLRLIVIGDPKVGKSSFAAGAPNPIFIPMHDGGIEALKVDQFPICASWAELLGRITWLYRNEHDYKTCIIDTVNGAETLCREHVFANEFAGDRIKFMAFNHGEKATSLELRRLIIGLDLLKGRGIDVILTAHKGLQTEMNSFGEEYGKLTANLSKTSWDLLFPWADIIGYATKDIRKVGSGEGKRAKSRKISDSRYIRFDGNAAADLGCRVGYEMPESCALDWDSFMEAKNQGHAAQSELAEQAIEILKELDENGAQEFMTKIAEWAGIRDFTMPEMMKVPAGVMMKLINRCLEEQKIYISTIPDTIPTMPETTT